MKSVSNDRRDNAVPHKVTLSPICTPMATIKCDGRAKFRSQQARDFACLLDLDPEVVRWSAAPPVLRDGDDEYQLEFLVLTVEGGSFLIDVGQEEPSPPIWLSSAIKSMGHRYRPVAMVGFADSFRLRNAKDLLRYGFYRAPLGDRIRLTVATSRRSAISIRCCWRGSTEFCRISLIGQKESLSGIGVPA